jgi:hypothetical protein
VVGAGAASFWSLYQQDYLKVPPLYTDAEYLCWLANLEVMDRLELLRAAFPSSPVMQELVTAAVQQNPGVAYVNINLHDPGEQTCTGWVPGRVSW